MVLQRLADARRACDSARNSPDTILGPEDDSLLPDNLSKVYDRGLNMQAFAQLLQNKVRQLKLRGY